MSKIGLFVDVLDGRDVGGELGGEDRAAPGDGPGQFGEFAQAWIRVLR